MAIYIRRAQEKDLTEIIRLIEAGKKVLSDRENPQWQDGHPTVAMMKDDIEHGYSWVLIDDKQVVGTAVLQLRAEQNYAEITDGQWAKSDEPYAIIHRLTIDQTADSQHLGKFFLSNLITVGYLQGVRNFRYDTHLKNVSMQKLGEGMGFVQRGTVYIKDDTDPEHLGYELCLEDEQAVAEE